MKHIRAISGTPQKAQTVTAGSLLTVLAQIVSTLGAFITQKEAANQITDA